MFRYSLYADIFAARISPIGASLLSSMRGLYVVILGFTLSSLITLDVLPWFNLHLRGANLYRTLFGPFPSSNDIDLTKFITQVYPLLIFRTMAPAFIIHLCLPLFALSSLVVKLVFWIFRAVEWAQWFVKQGDAHPLKAIGIVATIIVFGSAMVVKEAWTVL
jgi:hypothetical protein